MKVRTLTSIVALIAFVCFARPAAADDWADYNDFLNGYYFLDDLQTNQASCRLTLNTLNSIRDVLKPFGKNVEISDNLDVFRVSYERPQGIHVTEPKFSVTVKTTEGVANPDQLNRGVKQVNDGASQIISAAKTLVEDVLRGLTRPQKADMTGFHFKNDNGVATVDYVQGKQQIRSVYSDLRRETSTTQSGVTTSIADTFVLKNGKKTLFSSQTTVQAGNLVSTSVTSLQFQELQGGMFPSAIDQAVSVGFPGTQTSVKLSITFSDCLLVSTNLNQLPQPSDALPPGGGVSPPSVISSVKPQYPDTARNAKLQGTVVVEAIILEDGSLTVSKVVRGLGMGLDESAIDALKQWKFKPGMKDGKPVKVRLNIEVNFNLSTRATGK